MSVFTENRDAVVNFFTHVFTSFVAKLKDAFHVTFSDLEKIGEDKLSDVKTIVIEAVKATETAGGSWHEKRDAALGVILPQLTALGISLLTTSIDMLISNAVAELGYSKAA